MPQRIPLHALAPFPLLLGTCIVGDGEFACVVVEELFSVLINLSLRHYILLRVCLLSDFALSQAARLGPTYIPAFPPRTESILLLPSHNWDCFSQGPKGLSF